MSARNSPPADRRGRVLWYLRHPLVLFAIVEFVLLAGTVYLVLTRK